MKRREAKHRRPQPEQLRGGPYPTARASAVQLLLNANAPAALVPVELAERDYQFPQVQLPDARPLVDHTQLMAALDGDEPTQPLPVVGTVVDEAPRPAQHDGLAPVPVPSLPFLNAHPPRPAPSAPWLHVGNALPAALASVELMLLGRPIPQDAPRAVHPPAPGVPAPVRRDARHALVFGAFDAEFWEQIDTTVRQAQAGPGGLRMSTDDAMAALDEHLARIERAHQAAISQVAAHEYAGHLADASRPLPRRTPGAALAAIEASRRELVVS